MLAACAENDELLISIKRDNYLVSGRSVSIDQLSSLMEGSTNKTLYLCTDHNAPHAQVTDVVEIANDIGFKPIHIKAEDNCQ